MPSFSTTSRLSAAAGVALLAALGLSACGGDSPSADSSCSDYIDMSKDDQAEALKDLINGLAEDLDEDKISKKQAKKEVGNFAKICKQDEFKDGDLKDVGKKMSDSLDD